LFLAFSFVVGTLANVQNKNSVKQQ